MEDEGVNKVALVLALIGIVIIALGLYVSTLAGPLVGAGIVFIGGYLVIIPMSKALL